MATFQARVSILKVYDGLLIEADTLEDAVDAIDEMLVSQIEEGSYLEKELVIDRSVYEVSEADD